MQRARGAHAAAGVAVAGMARLWLHAVVDHVDEELHVALRLHEAAHVGEGGEELAILLVRKGEILSFGTG